MNRAGQTPRMEADRLFCARIEDMARQVQRDNLPCFSRFFDEREQALAKRVLREISFPQNQFFFWTGFDQEEEPSVTKAVGRRMLGLFPDYLSLDLGMDVSIWKEQFPISTVALFYRQQDALTHRDILGSLMGLNIKRELIGEILTAEDFAVIFCTQTAQQIILSELERVGKAGIKKEQGYTGSLPKAYRLEYQSGTVSSFRLDCIVSLAINASREKSAGLIESGLVNLNFFEETKISREVKEGDILSIRGYGRFVLTQVGSLSKKGRIHLTIGKYV